MIHCFNSEIVDGSTYITILTKPSFALINKLSKFLKERNGEFISDDKRNLRIDRSIKEKHIEKIFNELGIELILPHSAKRNEKNSSRELDDVNINIANDEERIITFGEFRGLKLCNIPTYYLKWLNKTSLDSNLKLILNKILSKRESYFIRIS